MMETTENKRPHPLDKAKSNQTLITLVIIAVFFLSLNCLRWLTALGLGGLIPQSNPARLIVGYLFWAVPTILTLLIIYNFDFDRVAGELGLKANPWKSLLWAFLFTIPMMIGYYAVSKKADLTTASFFENALLPGVFEEYIFRGFLIGQLFKRGRLGFIPAVLIGAVAFSAGHLYQGGTFPVLTGIVLITAIGSAWFAWLFIEWGRNLYLVMALHAFMNLWWSVFSAGQNALGGVSANLFRMTTVAITIVVTIIMARRAGLRIKGRDWTLAPKSERR